MYRMHVSMTYDLNRELMRMGSMVAQVCGHLRTRLHGGGGGVVWNMELVKARLCSMHSARHCVPLSLGLLTKAVGAVVVDGGRGEAIAPGRIGRIGCHVV